MITQEVLRNIARYIYENPNAHSIIAGGAPRDIDLGVNPKDVDIFVEVDNLAQETEYLKFMIDEMGYENFGRAVGEEYDRAMNPILSVHDFKIDLGENKIPVQFIFLDKEKMPEEDNIIKRVLKLFDVNVCRIALKYSLENDKTKIYKDAYYKDGVASKVVHETDTFYFDRGLDNDARINTRNRIRRIARKLDWYATFGYAGGPDREKFVKPEPVVVPEIDPFIAAMDNLDRMQNQLVQPQQILPGQIWYQLPARVATFNWNTGAM